MDDSDGALASTLVAEHGLAIENLQLALEWSGTSGRALADVLLEMRAVPEEVLKKVAKDIGQSPARSPRSTGPVERLRRDSAPRRDETAPRRFARVQRTLRVVLATWGAARKAYTLNIARGGLGFRLTEGEGVPAIGEDVTLTLEMPNGKQYELAARVRYAEVKDGGCAVGVEFATLGVGALLAIDALIRRHQPAEDDPTWIG